MLTRCHRLVSSALFSSTVRTGRRAGTRTMVLHLVTDLDRSPQRSPVQVGFVVSRAVGPAVTRNAVKRRLRHIARDRVWELPASATLVVRALPASASASFLSLCTDFDTALGRVSRSDSDARHDSRRITKAKA